MTTYPTRTQWRDARYAAACKALAAADRFFVLAPHETPADIRAPYSLAAWLALDAHSRSNHVRDQAYAAFDAENPKPEPALPRMTEEAPGHRERREPAPSHQPAPVRVFVRDLEAEARVKFAAKLYRAEAAAAVGAASAMRPAPKPAATAAPAAEQVVRSRTVVACARNCGRYIPVRASHKPARIVCRPRCTE